MSMEEQAAVNIADETVEECAYETVIIVADPTLAEVFVTLMKRSLIILYNPDDPDSVSRAIPRALFLIVLCNADSTVITRGLEMCANVRVMRAHSCVLAGATDAQMDSGDGASGVAYFDINDFFDYVPMPSDMFSVYLVDKFMATIFKCCYRAKTYGVTSEHGQYLLDGIAIAGQTVGDAIDCMVAEGLDNFSVESDYTTLGRMAPRLERLRTATAARAHVAVSVDGKDAFGGTGEYTIAVGRPLLPNDGVINVLGVCADGIIVDRTAEPIPYAYFGSLFRFDERKGIEVEVHMEPRPSC